METIAKKTTGLMSKSGERFREVFGYEHSTEIICPASFSYLGDHTHYNEGFLLTSAIDRYAAVVLSKRDDGEVNLIVGDIEDNHKIDLKKQTGEILDDNLRQLVNDLFAEEVISEGFDCVIISDIPMCVGLGRYSAHQSGLLQAVNREFSLGMQAGEMARFIRSSELKSLGKISNKGHHLSTFHAKKDNFCYLDLRSGECEPIKYPVEDYTFVICDTQKLIPDVRSTCNRRIEECEVGVKGLKLYVWGIKSLRDVSQQFLERHINMLPKIVYQRVDFNVKERLRVQEAREKLSSGEPGYLGAILLNSHRGLSVQYDLNYPELNFLVEQAENIPICEGAKLISCSPVKATVNMVKAGKVEEFKKDISARYMKMYKKELVFHVISSVDGALIEGNVI